VRRRMVGNIRLWQENGEIKMKREGVEEKRRE